MDKVGRQVQKAGNNIYKRFNDGKSIPGAENVQTNVKTTSASNSNDNNKDKSNSPLEIAADLALAANLTERDNPKETPMSNAAEAGQNNLSQSGKNQNTEREQSLNEKEEKSNVFTQAAMPNAPLDNETEAAFESFSGDEKTQNLEKVHTLAGKTGRTALASKSSRQLRSHIIKTQGKKGFSAYRSANENNHPEWKPKAKVRHTTLSPNILRNSRNSGYGF